MESKSAVDALSALAHEGRLTIFRALVRAGPDGLAAGKLGEVVGIGGSTLSNNLTVLTRAGLARLRADATPDAPCVAAVVYTYDHQAREVARKVTASHHDHHDLTISSMHVHLDQDQCLEVSILKGSIGEVRHFADHLVAQRNIQNGEVVIIPAGAAKRLR